MLNDVERSACRAFRSNGPIHRPENASPGEVDWIRFGLFCLMEAAQRLRSARLDEAERRPSFKDDGSPAVSVEREAEARVRQRLARFAPGVGFLGEETGGEMDPDGTTVALDPIDGTWSYVNGDDSYATTLAVFRGQTPFLGMVACPATGALAYATETVPARLVQLGLDQAPTIGHDLPLVTGPTNRPLVNLHPSRGMGAVMDALTSAWAAGEIRMVKSTGGSPARSLLDTARSGCVYVNLWAGKPADPFDLAAGILIVRGAGGDVVDLDCRSLRTVSHQGPFVAGIDPDDRRAVAGIVKKALA